jgi:hypothetical protein
MAGFLNRKETVMNTAMINCHLYRVLVALGAILLSVGSSTNLHAEPVQLFSYDIEPAFGLCVGAGDVVSARIGATEGGARYRLEMTVQDPTVEPVGCDQQTDAACTGTRDLPSRFLTAAEAQEMQNVIDDVLANVSEERGEICPLWDPCRIDTYTIDDVTLPVNPCETPWIEFEQGAKFLDLLEDLRDTVPGAGNGDVNGDHQRDTSDAIALLIWLFLSGPEPVFVPCALDCGGETIVLDNGDVNADFDRDITDALTLLTWLFLGGVPPEPICSCS